MPPPRRRLVGAFVGISLLVLGLPLFLAEVPRRRLVDAIVGISLVVLGLPGPAIAESRASSVVDVVETSTWSPPSPDAVGLTYDPVSARLLVVDSEVEEMSTRYAGVNGWIVQTDGGVDDTFVTVDPATGSFYTAEPTDITRDPSTGNFFISSDGPDRAFEVDPGPDGRMGGGDDVVVGDIRTLVGPFAQYPAHDVEGIAYGDGALYLANGVTAPAGNPIADIYEVLPGPDGLWSGSGQWDNVVSHWDTAGLGQSNPEGVTYDPETGHLLIVSNVSGSDIAETTTDGVLVGVIEGSGLTIRSASGLALAPASDGSGDSHLYVTDRGVDNALNPSENDGRIFELAMGVAAGSDLITNPGFEVHTSGWAASGSGVTLSRVVGGHSGEWTAKLANTGTSARTCKLQDQPNWVTTTTAGPYDASIWVRADTAGKVLTLRFREFVDGAQVGSNKSTITLDTSWQQIDLTYTPRTAGSTLDLAAYADAVPAGATAFYMDDAVITH